ncbi:MAG: dihydroxy-acid dehydratase, partial [Halothiobacillaceae bacterium]
HATTVECHFTIGTTLEIDLITTNNSQELITISQALHTYFAVSDVRNITIDGLEGTRYLDKVAGGLLKQQVGSVTIDAEVDRIYIDTTADCLINDPALQRRLRIQKKGSGSTVVWNPWSAKAHTMGDLGDDGYLQMVCVESANAADDLVTLAPGAHHHLWVRYGVEPL